MAAAYEALFEPLQVAAFTLRNRIVLPPMATNRRLASPESCEWYGQRAAGGVALVIVEATGVTQFAPRGALTADALRPLVDAIHAGGALAAIQLFAGRGKPSGPGPADLSPEEVRDLVAAFGDAARVCTEAGFDGVEAHGAHGFLLNQFFSPGPEHNSRTDAYGQDRGLLAAEIVRAMRAAAPGKLVLYRHTTEGAGYGMPESLDLAERLAAEGADILDVSPGGTEEDPCGLSAEVKRRVGGKAPVIGVWGLDDPQRAATSLLRGRADLVAVGRGLIADPLWPQKVKSGQAESIVRCVQCGGCFEHLRSGEPVACINW